MLDCWLLDPNRDRVPSPNLTNPFIALERSKRLCNGFVECFRRHFQAVLVSVRVFARYRAGPQGHTGIFSSFVRLYASTGGKPNVDNPVRLQVTTSFS